MDTLFTEIENEQRNAHAPLAVRMRPQCLHDVVGQEEALGPGSWLASAIETDSLTSVILFGPAGTGKTSIAHVIANTSHAHFVEVSAITGTVADLRREIIEADKRLITLGMRTILFVDEIHRFNRAQQDALLHAVENGTVVLVGATTENPFFEVNSALLSRSRVVELKRLSTEAISAILTNALESERGLAGKFVLSESARQAICTLAAGDARSALNTLALASSLAQASASAPANTKSASGTSAKSGTSEGPAGPAATDNVAAAPTDAALAGAAPLEPAITSESPASGSAIPFTITAEHVQAAVPHRTLPYDKKQDMHYDVISAFIKSMRGSDPDAALYWLARMLDGGEDPKFIARRIFIFAAEDIGNADPQAVLIGEAAFRAAEVIGMPECRINLAQAAVYMALAPKSNASYAGFAAAADEVKHGPVREVPNHLRDRHRPGSEAYGQYLYPHNYPSGYVEQQYLPDGLERGAFYTAGQRGWERYRVDASARDKGNES